MNRYQIFSGTACLMLAAFCPSLTAEEQSLAASLDVQVFPSAGQAADQQSKDESECYQWAVTNSGVDPFKLADESEAQQQQAQQAQQEIAGGRHGSGVRGAARGAAAGAVVGEIADDDAGQGAAYGAAAGAVASRHRSKRAQQEASAELQQQTEQTQAANTEKRGNFNNAFSACLEGKQYQVEF